MDGSEYDRLNQNLMPELRGNLCRRQGRGILPWEYRGEMLLQIVVQILVLIRRIGICQVLITEQVLDHQHRPRAAIAFADKNDGVLLHQRVVVDESDDGADDRSGVMVEIDPDGRLSAVGEGHWIGEACPRGVDIKQIELSGPRAEVGRNRDALRNIRIEGVGTRVETKHEA